MAFALTEIRKQLDDLVDMKITDRRKNVIIFDSEAPNISPKESYDLRAPEYDKHLENDYPKNLCNQVDLVFQEYLNKNAKKDSSMLDIGTGNGLRMLKYKDLKFVGKLEATDISPKMVEIARKNSIDARVESFSDIKGNYDIITALFGVMGIMREEEIQQTFNRIYDSLNEGGIFCFDVMAGDIGHPKESYEDGKKFSIYYNGREIDGKWVPTRPDMSKPRSRDNEPIISWARVYGKDELIEIATKAGFTVELIRGDLGRIGKGENEGYSNYGVILKKQNRK